jgi:cell division protein FtsI (penicillin-binding protein 3)
MTRTRQERGRKRRNTPRTGGDSWPDDTLHDGESLTARAVENGRTRLALTASAFMLVFVMIAWRMVELGHFSDEPGAGHGPVAASQLSHRADLVDRRGRLIATDITVKSLYADASQIWDPDGVAEQLAAVLPRIDVARTRARLASGRRFEWIARELTPREHYAVHNLGIPGLNFRDEPRRFYPLGEAAAHVVGYTNIDNRGIAGMELTLDAALIEAGRAGAPVALSIDLGVQHALRDEIARGLEEFSAKAGTGIVLDIMSGEVLALVSLPDFNPNHARTADADRRYNRATAGVYELGSTFKAFTTALALDSGVANTKTVYDATHPLRVGRFTIGDYRGQKRPLTVSEIFFHSSNIGTAQLARDIGRDRQRDFLRALGMLERIETELPETGMPLLPGRWGELETMTISYGHGIAVSPLHLATGVAALINGGHAITPTFIKRDGAPRLGPRVIREETSQQMRALFRLVVEKGTASRADAPGYPVGGKTGSADKAVRGGYAKRALITSFVGAFPMDDPRYVVLVVLDEPQGTPATHGFATAGWNAAPIVGRAVSRIGPLLGIPPREDEQLLARRHETLLGVARAPKPVQNVTLTRNE